MHQRYFYVEQGIVGAQTKGQFHMIYGSAGTQALFTELATQIVYGGWATTPPISIAKHRALQPLTLIKNREKRISGSAHC